MNIFDAFVVIISVSTVSGLGFRVKTSLHHGLHTSSLLNPTPYKLKNLNPPPLQTGL
jgi:hypothetical protein